MAIQPPTSASDWLHVAAAGPPIKTVHTNPTGVKTTDNVNSFYTTSTTAATATDDWNLSNRPQKKLRTVRSHASALRPIVRLVRDPFSSIGAIAESLGIRERVDPREQECRLQKLRLQGAKSRQEWEDAAQELDRLEGNEEWKLRDESPEYDYELVKSRLQRLEDAHTRKDLEELRFLVRTSLTRDLGGMGEARLYRHTHMGTKRLIEQYNEAVLDTLELLVDNSGRGPYVKLDAREMQDQIKQTRQAFGRSALLLSGGGTFGMNHIGVAKCLFEAELLPRIISGASAGSIVAAVVCAKLDDEIPDVLRDFCNVPLDVFESKEEPASTIGRCIRLMKTGAIYDVANLKRVMRDILGDLTFLEAYNRTQRILNICVSTSGIYDQPRLLNYITAPDVLIWSAVAASCSVPGVFTSAQLLVRDSDSGEQRPWDDTASRCIDGSVDNDLPMTRLAEMLNVNHFIVSQVNPHVVPFLPKHDDEMSDGHGSHTLPGLPSNPSWLQTTAGLAKGEALHRLHVMAELGVWPGMMTKLRSILGQRYSGDITILPELSFTQFPLLLSNPTPEFMLQAMYNGERATWPKLSRIRNHLAVELALDKAVHKLIARVVFSPSQVDVRLGLFQNRKQPIRGRRRGSRGSQHSAHSVMFLRPGTQESHDGSVPQSWNDRPANKNEIADSQDSDYMTISDAYSMSISSSSTSSTLCPDDDGYQLGSESGPAKEDRSYRSQPSTPMLASFPPHQTRPTIHHHYTNQSDLLLRSDRKDTTTHEHNEYPVRNRPLYNRNQSAGSGLYLLSQGANISKRLTADSNATANRPVKPLQPIPKDKTKKKVRN